MALDEFDDHVVDRRRSDAEEPCDFCRLRSSFRPRRRYDDRAWPQLLATHRGVPTRGEPEWGRRGRGGRPPNRGRPTANRGRRTGSCRGTSVSPTNRGRPTGGCSLTSVSPTNRGRPTGGCSLTSVGQPRCTRRSRLRRRAASSGASSSTSAYSTSGAWTAGLATSRRCVRRPMPGKPDGTRSVRPSGGYSRRRTPEPSSGAPTRKSTSHDPCDEVC